MKKNKIAALALSGALLVGATALGTFAYFQDTANANTKLVVTTGTLDVEINETQDWQVGSSGEISATANDKAPEVTNPNDKNNFQNVRPGDKFSKIMEVENKGSLKQRITFNINNFENAVLVSGEGKEDLLVSDLFDVDVKAPEAVVQGKDFILEPREKASFRIDVKLKNNVENVIKGHNIQKAKFDLSTVGQNTVEVIANQVNAGK